MRSTAPGTVMLMVLTIVAVAQTGTADTLSRRKRTASSMVYKSRDGSLLAIIKSWEQPEATPESRIEVRTNSGKVLATRSYRSEDGEHGYGVTKAQWTPDSEYFVFSLESSGGHQAWHSPVQYFSRKRTTYLSFDDTLADAVTNPDFRIAAPDKITVDLWFSQNTRTVSLSSLQGTETK